MLSRGWSDATSGRVLALHAASPCSIPGISYSPLSLPRVSPDYRAMNNPWLLQVVPQKNQMKVSFQGSWFILEQPDFKKHAEGKMEVGRQVPPDLLECHPPSINTYPCTITLRVLFCVGFFLVRAHYVIMIK